MAKGEEEELDIDLEEWILVSLKEGSYREGVPGERECEQR